MQLDFKKKTDIQNLIQNLSSNRCLWLNASLEYGYQEKGFFFFFFEINEAMNLLSSIVPRITSVYTAKLKDFRTYLDKFFGNAYLRKILF